MHSGFTLNRLSLFTVERPPLDQFVLLSLMLHVLVIVLFGDTSGGGARRGEKSWGALTVTVRGLLPDRTTGSGLKPDRGAVPPGRAATETRPAPASPGVTTQDRQARVITPAETAPPTDQAPPPAQAPSFEIPPLMSKAVEKPVTEFVVPKPSIDRAFAAATPAPPSEQPTRETPVDPPPAIPPPVVVAPASEPVAPPVIEPARLVPLPLVAPVAAKRREETAAPPTVETPDEPIPKKIERELVKPLVPAPEPKPLDIAQPVVRSPPPQPVVPAIPKPEREIAQPPALAARELPAAPPVAPPALSEPPPRAEAPKAPIVEPADAPAAASVAAPANVPSGTPAGTPRADRDPFTPRGDTPTPPVDTRAPGKASGIDLDAVRRRAREITSGGSGPRTVFPFPVAPPPKPKSKEQQAFDKALKKNDCRDAYAGLGLAAVVPLVLDAVRDDGCKW